jgi:hypothetical protein
MGYKLSCVLALVLAAQHVTGQFKLPSFEVAVKGGYTFADEQVEDQFGSSSDETYEAAYVHGEASVHLGQHIAIGYFYQQSVMGMYHNGHNGGGSGVTRFEYDAGHLFHGLNLRFSTGRTSKLRPYIQVKYFSAQWVVDYGDFDIARKGAAVGGGVGLMMRVGHSLYINLIEVEACLPLTDSDVLLTKNNVFPTARFGVTYNFSKRK